MGILLWPVRWLTVFMGAALGGYVGRIGAAALRGEPVEPLLQLDRSVLFRPDVVPGFLAVEIIGKFVKLSMGAAMLVAAIAAAVAALVEGPLVSRPSQEPDADAD